MTPGHIFGRFLSQKGQNRYKFRCLAIFRNCFYCLTMKLTLRVYLRYFQVCINHGHRSHIFGLFDPEKSQNSSKFRFLVIFRKRFVLCKAPVTHVLQRVGDCLATEKQLQPMQPLCDQNCIFSVADQSATGRRQLSLKIGDQSATGRRLVGD